MSLLGFDSMSWNLNLKLDQLMESKSFIESNQSQFSISKEVKK